MNTSETKDEQIVELAKMIYANSVPIYGNHGNQELLTVAITSFEAAKVFYDYESNRKNAR
jgi:hypothetical protein